MMILGSKDCSVSLDLLRDGKREMCSWVKIPIVYAPIQAEAKAILTSTYTLTVLDGERFIYALIL